MRSYGRVTSAASMNIPIPRNPQEPTLWAIRASEPIARQHSHSRDRAQGALLRNDGGDRGGEALAECEVVGLPPRTRARAERGMRGVVE